jgi:hypothetical protein
LLGSPLASYFVAEGILITAALTHHRRMAIHVLGGAGCVSSLIFRHMFVRARWFELINSRWLRVNAQIDHGTIADSVTTPEGYEKQFADHWPTTRIVLLPARIIWPVVLFVSAVRWAIYAFGVFEQSRRRRRRRSFATTAPNWTVQALPAPPAARVPSVFHRTVPHAVPRARPVVFLGCCTPLLGRSSQPRIRIPYICRQGTLPTSRETVW